MSEEIKIIDGTFKKDDPHKDIGKQKFRVRKPICERKLKTQISQSNLKKLKTSQ